VGAKHRNFFFSSEEGVEGRKEGTGISSSIIVGNYSFVCLFVCFLPDRMIVINNVTVWREGGREGGLENLGLFLSFISSLLFLEVCLIGRN